MSVRAMSWVWSHSRSKPTQRLVLLAIADCANDRGADAYPSNATLAGKTGLTDRAVRRAVVELEELGELAVQYKTGPRGTNRYQVIMRDPERQSGSDGTRNERPGTRNDIPGVDPEPQSGYPERGSANPEPQSADPERGSPEPSLTVQNHKTSSSEPAPPARRRTKREPDRPDVEQLCRHLADRIEANGSKRPTVTDRWRKAARLMLDADERTVEQVERAIDWCQDDEFWRANVLSMPKLRDKYDQLRLAAQRNGARPNGAPAPPAGGPIPLDQQCPEHRGYPAGLRDDGEPRCGLCRADQRGGTPA